MTHFVNAYQYSHDPALLPTLRHLADSCMDRVDVAGLGGVDEVDLLLWHPLWISRYHEQTRVEGDIARIQLLAESLGSRSVYHSNSMALAALAYDLGSDATALSMTTSAGSFPCEIAKRVGEYEQSGDVEPRFWKRAGSGLGGGLPHRAGSQLDMAWPYWLAASRRAAIEEPVTSRVPRSKLERTVCVETNRWIRAHSAVLVELNSCTPTQSPVKLSAQEFIDHR